MNIDEKYKNLIHYSFPSVSDLKLKSNEFLYEKKFVIFLINSLLSFFYSGDRLLIDNDFLSYYKINFKISKNDEEDKSSDKNSNFSNINQSHYIIDILLDKMSFLKYGPSNIKKFFRDIIIILLLILKMMYIVGEIIPVVNVVLVIN